MGNWIFGSIVILIYGAIIYHITKKIRNDGHVCSCKSCPASELINKEGKIDLLFAVSQMENEGSYESKSHR